MFRPPKPKEEEKPEAKPEHQSNEKTQQIIIRSGCGPMVTRGLLTAADIVTAIKGGTWNIDNLLNPHPVTVGNFPSEYPLPSAQVSDLKDIRTLGPLDVITVYNLLNPHPVAGDLGILRQHSPENALESWIYNFPAEYPLPSQQVTDLRNIRALTSTDIVTVYDIMFPSAAFQGTRTSLKMQPEREDIVSLGGVASPNNAGVQIIAGVSGQKIKVYDAGYHGAVDGTHYFYFGTTTTATTRRFCTANKLGLVHKTFVQPRIGNSGDGLYLFSSVAETNMPYDIGYVQE